MNCDAAKVLLVQIGRNNLIDAKLRTLALEHARGCRSCGLRLTNERTLSAGLHMLAEEHLSLEPPPQLECAVMAAFHGEFAKRNAKRSYHAKLWSVAAAVAACLAVIGLVRQPLRSPAARAGEVRMEESMALPADGDDSSVPVAGQSFISIPYAEPFAPDERTELQQVKMTRGTLTAMGIGLGDGHGFAPDPDEAVNAEIVVGQDGVPRAVRLLN